MSTYCTISGNTTVSSGSGWYIGAMNFSPPGYAIPDIPSVWLEPEEEEDWEDMKMSIGGNGETTCHLCGAKVVKESYTKILTKDEDEEDLWIYDRERKFECGTKVTQHDEDKPKVTVGGNCIQFTQD